MDRYDAILEQLKQARSRGLESVTGRLDALVETLGELIETTKSTAQTAFPSDAEDIFPLADVESLVEELRRESIEREEAREREEAKQREAVEAAPAAGISLDNLLALDGARSQSELLRALLPLLAEHVGRVVVLVIRDGVVTAWSGIGFPDGENLRGWNGGVAASPDFQRLVDTAKPIAFTPRTDPLISQWLSGEAIPDEGVLLPISLRGKLMGMVYLDHDGEQPWNVEAAQSLNAVACWLIDTLHHRTVVPTPMLAEIEAIQPPIEDAVPSDVFEAPAELEEIEAPIAEVVDEPAEPESYEMPPVPEPEPEEVSSEVLEFETAADQEIEIVSETFSDQIQETVEEPVQEQVEEEIAEIDYDFEPAPAPAEEVSPEAGFDPSATVRVEASEEIEREEYPAEAENFPISRVIEAPPEEPPAMELPETPPPIRPIEPPAEPAEPVVSSEDDARQEEARRFARLLVSEIKLYNEDEVERGRVEKDLGERLKDDIERSREMYEKRIPAEVRTGRDYFQDELVRILADGDADAFGG